MMRTSAILGVVLVMLASTAAPAFADWLLTGYLSPLLNVKTARSGTLNVPAERFEDSVGVGINLASAFPARGNLGFELDLGWYPSGLRSSDQFDTAFASQLVSLSTNFFYSPAVPRVRPYFSVGPSFNYRLNHGEAVVQTPSGWAFGVNGGAGIMGFINQRVGVRVDVRYFRNFGDFYDLREDVASRRTGWSELEFIRLFVGATFVL